MDESRSRISVTLTPGWHAFLRWWAAECERLPAEVARQLIEAGLERARAAPGVEGRYADWTAGRQVEDTLTNDIVAAMSMPGVPAVLGGDLAQATNGAAQAAAFLVELSGWLADERPVAAKPPRPRLATTPALAPFGASVGLALDAAGGADGRTMRQSRAEGVFRASDKRQLSDVASAGPQEALDARD